MFYRIDPAAITTVSAWDAFRSHRLPDFASIERSLEQTGWKLVSLTLQKLHAHEIGTSRRFRRIVMAKKRKRKYSRGSSEEVRREMHRYERGKAKSGKGGKGGTVKSRKQAIAIALSKARKKGKRVPRKKK
jgi:Family of unknown function (DUF6496)